MTPITTPLFVVAVLLAVLAALFTTAQTGAGKKFFARVPLLVFAYFVPTLLSNVGVIPKESMVYDFIKASLLPASLVLLTLSVDLKAILRLGRPAVTLFLVGTGSIVMFAALPVIV